MQVGRAGRGAGLWGCLLLRVHVQVLLEELVVAAASMMITNVYMHATGLALAGNKHSLS